MRKRPSTIAAVAVAAACLLGACGSSKSSSSTAAGGSGSGSGGSGSGATSSLPAGAGTGAGGSCGKYTGGKGGVIRTFCDGPAVVHVTAAGKQFTVKGGTCDQLGGYFNLNAGVVVGPDFSGAKPDYVGLVLPATDGAFSHATAAAITIGGTGYALVQSSGSHAAKSGEIHGTSYGENVKVDATFTC